MFKIIGGDGRPYGPVSADQIRQWIAEGRANAQTLAQAEGSVEWKPLGLFPEFASSAAPPVIPPTPTAAPTPSFQPRQHVPSYLVPAIFSTICCCLPFGIVAIVFAAQVNTKLQAGDMAGALEASQKAKTWFWLAVVLGVLSLGLLWTPWCLPFLRFHTFRFHRAW
ncbi:MAG: CD225/dispanin family protein [Verrucomicrobiia bacterium]